MTNFGWWNFMPENQNTLQITWMVGCFASVSSSLSLSSSLSSCLHLRIICSVAWWNLEAILLHENTNAFKLFHFFVYKIHFLCGITLEMRKYLKPQNMAVRSSSKFIKGTKRINWLKTSWFGFHNDFQSSLYRVINIKQFHPLLRNIFSFSQSDSMR